MKIKFFILAALCMATISIYAQNFNGLDMNMGNLYRLSNAKTRSISPENFTGEKGKGGMADPITDKEKINQANAHHAAKTLGQGWKVNPYVNIGPNETFTLAEIEGPGSIQQIWMTPTGEWRKTIIRFYWDDEKEPSVECPIGDFFCSGWGLYSPLSSLAVCVNPGSAFNCYWQMPFRKKCKITMENIDPNNEMRVYYKVTDERGCAVTRAIYNVLSIDREGHKELLGMYISRNEGANFWLSVLTDLQNRGVEDILIACIDGLKGFPEAIQSVYPNTAVQLCVVHQIRNSIKYVGSKNQKEFLRDLKCVYQAVNKESAENELLKLDEKWGEQYPVVIRSWQDNWDKLSEYFQYTPVIRKLIYTTNTVEGYHRQIRKVTKNKGVFPSDTALEKLVYLAYRNIRKKWTMPLANWATISQQLAIKFGNRFKLL